MNTMIPISDHHGKNGRPQVSNLNLIPMQNIVLVKFDGTVTI